MTSYAKKGRITLGGRTADEGEVMVSFKLTVPKAVYEALERRSTETGRSKSLIVSDLLRGIR